MAILMAAWVIACFAVILAMMILIWREVMETKEKVDRLIQLIVDRESQRYQFESAIQAKVEDLYAQFNRLLDNWISLLTPPKAQKK